MRLNNPLLILPCLCLWFTVLVAAQAQEPILIGDLSELAHDVSGTVYALDDRTLMVEDLTYDGLGPAGVFWVDTVNRATSNGRIVAFKDSCEAESRLPAYSGQSVTLELPADITLADVRYFSMWCRAVDAEFGGVSIPENFVTANNVPQVAVAPCANEGGSEMTGVFPVQDGWNCERMSDLMQMRWKVDSANEAIDIELIARLDESEYVGFGPSGQDTFTQMVGSDVVIAALLGTSPLSYSMEDYSMTAQLQCSNGVGVCADTKLASNAGENSITEVAANWTSGVSRFVYRRGLKATEDIDRDINLEGESYVTWAIGPFDGGEPNFHPGSTRFPQKDEDGVARVMVEWGRSPSNACPVFVATDDEEEIPGFVRPTLSNVTALTARIGPSGGVRGVGAITGSTAWGIAWYLSPTDADDGIGTLIPVLGVERGKTYNFTVYGGRFSEGSEVHPFYITNSSEGGYIERSPSERLTERVYAGIEPTVYNASGVYNFTSTGEGSLCELTSQVVNTDNMTWAEYKETINASCTENETITNGGGMVSWTVPQDAEDVVYYQCVTHRFLGFKIAVFDAGEVNETRLEELSGGAELALDGDKNCSVVVNGEDVAFAACETEKQKPLQMYYSIDDAAGTIDTLFRVPREEDRDYVSFGWGYSRMVEGNGSNVMVGLIDDAESRAGSVAMYTMTSRSSADVRPTAGGIPDEVTDAIVDVSDDFLTVRFTRALSSASEFLPEIDPSKDTPFIWATGSRAQPESAALQKHAAKGTDKINLSSGRTISSRQANTGRLRVHAILMTIAWGLFVPWAILTMRFGKRWNPTAFNVHRITNTLSVGVSAVAFLLALFSSGRRTDPAHRIIGYVIVGVSVVQVAGGVLRPHKDGSSKRRAWYIGHSVVGASTAILAAVNIFLGIALNFFEYRTLWRVLVAVNLAMVGFLAVVMSALPRVFPTKEELINASHKEQEAHASA